MPQGDQEPSVRSHKTGHFLLSMPSANDVRDGTK
jgi:hypothetical protein